MSRRKIQTTTSSKRLSQGEGKVRHKATRTQAETSSRQGALRSESQPQNAQRDASHSKVLPGQPEPVFISHFIVGPDGRERPAWEMWVGNLMFGRAESKEALLAYYTRLHEPMPSGHWRDRSWQALPKKSTKSQDPAENEPALEEEDDPLVLEEVFDNGWEE